MTRTTRAKRWGRAASAAAMMLAASAQAADSAYFSILGTFSTDSGAYEDFWFTTPSGSSPMVLQTLSFSGGTTAAGETTAGGGIDSILSLYLASAPATPIATNDDRGGGSRDSLLAYNGSGNTYLAPLAAGNYKLHLANYANVAGDRHWVTEMINTGGSLTLTDWSGVSSGAGSLTLGGSGNATAVVPVPAGKSLGIYTLNVNTRGRVSIIGGTLTVNEGITLNGGRLERTAGTLAWAGGKTMTIKNGGVFNAGGEYIVPSGGTINISGPGSRIDCTRLGIGRSGGFGEVIFDNGANQTLPAVDLPVDAAGNSRGTLTVRGGSTITVGDLRLSSFLAPDIPGTVTVTGADTSLTQSGDSLLMVGNANQSTAKLEVLAEGSFTSGTGPVTVGTGAQIKVDGGIFRAKGPVTVSAYGQILGLDALDIPWMSFDEGLTLEADAYLRFATTTPSASITTRGDSTIKKNSHFELGSAQWLLAGDAFIKQQARVESGEQYPGKLRIIEGGALFVEAGGQVQIGALRIENGMAYLDQPEASVIASAPSAVGTNGTGSLLIKRDGWARLTSLDVGPCVVGETGSGAVTVEEGGHLQVADLRLGTYGGNGQSATMTVRSGGTVEQEGAAALTVGWSAYGSTAIARIRVEQDGSFVSGTGPTVINATGRIDNFDRFVAKGSMTVNSGAIVNSRGDYAEALFDVTGDLTIHVGATVNVVGMPAHRSELAVHGKTIVANGGSLLLNNSNSRLTAYDDLTIRPWATFTAAGEVMVGKAMKVQDVAATAATLLNAGSVTVDGAIARLSGTYAEMQNNSSLSLLNGGKFDYTTLRMEGLGVTAWSASLNTSNGEVLAKDILLGTTGNAAHSHSINLTGPAAKLTQYAGGQFTLGSAAASAQGAAALNLSGGATLTQPAGAAFVLNRTGTLNIAGSTATLANLSMNGGTFNILDSYVTLGSAAMNSGAFNFTSGQLTIQSNLSIGTGRLLGSSLTLAPSRKLIVGGPLTVDPWASLTLDGGALSAGSLVANGTFQFLRGDLAITGAGGLTVGTGGMLGSAVGLGAGKRLTVNAATTIASTGLLNVDEGSFVATGGLTNNGEIRLSHPLSQLSGGTLVNNRLLLGEGRIANSLVNNGEVRVTGAERMVLEGDEVINAGRINLLGGTVEVKRTLVNDPGGQINGRGTLIAMRGLFNEGQMTLSGGFTDIFGEMTGAGESKITLTGGSTATFYDFAAFEEGAEVFVNTGSTAVFLGGVEGGDVFTGGGQKVFQSGSSSIGWIATAGSTVVESAAEVAVDCVREAALTVNGELALAAGGTMSRVGSLALAGSAQTPEGRLDLGDSALIVQSTPQSRLADLQRLTAQIAAARNGDGGMWQSNGIGTRFGDELTGLAILLNDRGDGTPLMTTFGDQPVDASSILIATTWAGDLTLDGRVDGMDYLRLDRGLLTGQSGYAGGDIDYSGRTDGDDYFLIDRAFLGQSSISGPSGTAPVPEPGAAAVLLMAGMLLARRRAS